MPRIQPLKPTQADGAARAIFDDFMRERGNIPNMFATLAHIPRLLETTFAHFRAVMTPVKVPLIVKELVAVRVSMGNDCDYCLASHTKIARGLGVTEETILQLKNVQLGKSEYGGLDEGAQAALRFADEMRDGGKKVSDEAAEAVRRIYGDEGLLEVAMVAGFFHYVNRVNNALQVEITK